MIQFLMENQTIIFSSMFLILIFFGLILWRKITRANVNINIENTIDQGIYIKTDKEKLL